MVSSPLWLWHPFSKVQNAKKIKAQVLWLEQGEESKLNPMYFPLPVFPQHPNTTDLVYKGKS